MAKPNPVRPNEHLRAELRSRALAWPEEDLRPWKQVVKAEQANAKDRDQVVRTLNHWKEDPDLASIRGPEAIAKLPESEREGFTTLWAEVDRVLGSLAISETAN